MLYNKDVDIQTTQRKITMNSIDELSGIRKLEKGYQLRIFKERKKEEQKTLERRSKLIETVRNMFTYVYYDLRKNVIDTEQSYEPDKLPSVFYEFQHGFGSSNRIDTLETCNIMYIVKRHIGSKTKTLPYFIEISWDIFAPNVSDIDKQHIIDEGLANGMSVWYDKIGWWIFKEDIFVIAPNMECVQRVLNNKA